MVKELELIAADAAANASGRPSHGKPGAHDLPDSCANCGTELKGRWCYACGQSADDHHRSLVHLLKEGVEGLFHFDGRLQRTLPALFFKPGRLIDDYFNGRIVRHMPPFRLFLVSLFLYILAAEAVVHGAAHQPAASGEHSAPGKAAVFTINPTTPTAGGQGDTVTANPFSATPEERRVLADRIRRGAVQPDGPTLEAENWVVERLARAIENLDLFMLTLFGWAHRLAVLLLPIQAGVLGLLYIRNKRWLIYDHLIFSMTQLSFTFLVFALVFILPQPVRDAGVIIATLWTPVNLYFALRGGYGSGVWGGVAKTMIVWVATLFSFSLLIGGLVMLSLNQV